MIRLFCFVGTLLLGNLSFASDFLQVHEKDPGAPPVQQRAHPHQHQTLDEFLKTFDPVVHPDLKPFFTKAWTAIFEEHEKVRSQPPATRGLETEGLRENTPRAPKKSAPKKRLSAKKEADHTLCLLRDLQATREEPEIQFLHIVGRLGTKTHLELLSKHYTPEEIAALLDYKFSYFVSLFKS